MVSKYATVNPATGEFIQGFETISDADADRALDRAHEAYLDWRGGRSQGTRCGHRTGRRPVPTECRPNWPS